MLSKICDFFNLKCAGNEHQKKCALYSDGKYTREGDSWDHKYLVKVHQIRQILSVKRKSQIQKEYVRCVKLYISKVKSENLVSEQLRLRDIVQLSWDEPKRTNLNEPKDKEDTSCLYSKGNVSRIYLHREVC